ncbi:methyltransferase [Candidatus Woesearchaeota archaeon]|nr:methyltransferase [Candidatus Woesearchaeota archaeon]
MEHYYTEKPISRLRIKEIEVSLRGNSLKFCTGSGVFSVGKIDKGTKLLIESSMIKPAWKILDLGSGYGPVGISLAKAFPSSKVIMSDINNRSVKLSRMNIRLNNLNNITARQSGLYENIEEKFNTILTNPPQSAGKKICFEMIEGAKVHLVKKGLLQLVCRHKKGGIELKKKMLDVFGNVKEIAKGSGYRVYVSEL